MSPKPMNNVITRIYNLAPVLVLVLLFCAMAVFGPSARAQVIYGSPHRQRHG